MAENIVIIGAGGFGREVLSFIDRNHYNPVGFIDPNPPKDIDLSIPVLGDNSFTSELRQKDIASCVCIALGDMNKRQAIHEQSLQCDLKIPPIIHPNTSCLTQHTIGEGAIIYPNVVLMDNCKINKGVLLNSGVTLGHDVEVGDFSNINPGVNLAGRIKVGKQVMIGIGSCVREQICIGDHAVIGAGSVVLKDVDPMTTVFGVPARLQQKSI